MRETCEKHRAHLDSLVIDKRVDGLGRGLVVGRVRLLAELGPAIDVGQFFPSDE